MWHVYLYLHHYNSWTNNIVWLGTGKSLCMAKKLFMTQTTNLGSVSGCKSISHNFGVDSSNFLNIGIKVLQTIDSGLYYKPLLKTTFLFWWFFCSPFFTILLLLLSEVRNCKQEIFVQAESAPLLVQLSINFKLGCWKKENKSWVFQNNLLKT